MSDLREAAQQALEALDNIDKEFKKHGRQHWPEAVKARNAAPALRTALAQPNPAQRVVDEQAEDEGLWFRAQTAAEAYLQQELRRLHAAVEGEK